MKIEAPRDSNERGSHRSRAATARSDRNRSWRRIIRPRDSLHLAAAGGASFRVSEADSQRRFKQNLIDV